MYLYIGVCNRDTTIINVNVACCGLCIYLAAANYRTSTGCGMNKTNVNKHRIVGLHVLLHNYGHDGGCNKDTILFRVHFTYYSHKMSVSWLQVCFHIHDEKESCELFVRPRMHSEHYSEIHSDVTVTFKT